MAAKPPAVAGRKEIHPGIIVDQINKELGRQQDFGKVWGSLVSPDYPTTPAEALALRRAELQKLEAATGGAVTTLNTTSRAEFATRKPLETGLGKAYKTLKAGV